MEPKEIFEALRDKIICLDLAPESVLNLSELATEFNVSRTPIKEVLISLQAEEWIVRQGPHFIVTPLSLERIREITEIRMVLEVQANIWAMQRITPAELENLEQLRQRTAAFDANSTQQEYLDFDFLFHSTIFKAAKNSQMAKLLERLLKHYLRFWLAVPRQMNPNAFFAESLDLIQAIMDKDEAKVRDCTVHHIRNSVSTIMGTQ